MNRLNSHFLRPSPTAPEVSGDGQSALVDKLEVSPSRTRLLTGSHHYHPGIVKQAQGCSSETTASPHHNNQSKMCKEGDKITILFNIPEYACLHIRI
jgi:hypothetical protein